MINRLSHTVMQKSESEPSPQPIFKRSSSKMNVQGFWLLIAFATLLLVGSSWFAYKQEPHPDAYRAAPDWFSSDFWWYPVERNAFKRLSSINVSLRAIHVHADGQHIWVTGSGGAIVHSSDGGKSWQGQVSGTREALNSITFTADGQRGWAVGSAGTILHTADGGKSWQSIAYRMPPAPWFYVVLVLIALVYFAAFGWRVWQIRQTGKQTSFRSVFDHAATDRPVGHDDPDFLGARCIAAGLAHFLTNAKTEPPLTLAVTGDWGSGKSSLMNYFSSI